ncbi:MAG: phospholipid carrier-dependent glycosyltransferase [Nitrospirae bacterium]|nr:phospholipid carrier-dependent glycosyltransferase [Nitrospirota bacterium]
MNSHKKPLLIIFISALIIRILFVLLMPQEAPDTKRYDDIALSLLSRGDFSTAQGDPAISDGPIYPLFLAAIFSIFGHSLTAVRLIQAIIDSFTCLIIYLIALQMNQRKSIAILASAMAAIYPELIASSAFVLTETLFTFLLSVSTLLLLRAKFKESKVLAVISGIFFGITILCRAVALLIPPFLFLSFLFFSNRKRNLSLITILTIAMLLTIAPWTIRNFLVFDRFLPVSIGLGGNLWIGSYQPWQGDYNYKDLSDKKEIEAGLSPIEADQRLKEEALKNIKENPLGYLRLFPRKFARFWFKIPGGKEVLKGKTLSKDFLYTIHFLLLFFFALGLWFSLRKRTFAILTPLLIILYFTLIHVILFAIPRYRIPITPFILIFSAMGLYRAINLIFSPRLLSPHQ